MNSSANVSSTMFRSSPDSGLSQLYSMYSATPFLVSILGHCFTVASLNQDVKDRFLLHYWLCCAGGFGGSILSTWLLMSSSKAPIEFLSMNSIALAWTLAWWAYNYSPGRAIRGLLGSFPLQVVFHALSAFGGAEIVTYRVNQVVEMYPSVYLAPIIIATMAGSGGLYLEQMIRGGLGLQQSEPLEILQPSFVTRIALVTAAGHYALVHFWHVLLPEESTAIWITVWVSHQLASDLLGRSFDFTLPLFQLLSKISNIPLVPAKPASAVKKQVVKAAQKAAAAAEGTKAKQAEGKAEAKKDK